MDAGQAILLLLSSLGASALGGALGMASGIFIVPLLTVFFAMPLHAAVAASIVSVIACSCGSGASFLRGGLTNIRIAIVLEIATTLGAITGVVLGGQIPVSFLYALFSLILIVSAKQMLARRIESISQNPRGGRRDMATILRLHSVYPDQEQRDVFYYVQRVPLGLSFMYGAGVISALLGIGSGVLKIPAMDSALRLPIKVSSATSNFMIGVTAAASGVAYYIRGDIDPMVAGPVALGSVVGSLLGARLLMGLPADKLRLFFVVVLIALAIQMGLYAFGVRFI